MVATWFLAVLVGLVVWVAVAAPALRPVPQAESARSSSARARRLAWAGMVIFPLVLGLVHGLVASPKELETLVTREQERGVSLTEAREQLLALHDNPAGLMEYAMLYRGQGAYDLASLFLRQAVLHDTGNPDLLALYGESLVLYADGRVTDEALRQFNLARELRRDHPQAGFFIGLAALQQGDRAQAVDVWESVLQDLSDDHPLRARIAAMMAGKE
jgi:cytochrome c-type biogenesis protein CcmH